jgi:hypothetical protein
MCRFELLRAILGWLRAIFNRFRAIRHFMEIIKCNFGETKHLI